MFRHLVFLSFFLPSALYADLKLVFEIEQTTETPSTDARHPKPSRVSKKYPLTVILSADAFISTDDHESVLIDFSEEKTYVISTAEKSYRIYSLYSDLGFRVSEYTNRLSIEKSISPKTAKEKSMNALLTEHLLSLREPEGAPLKPKNAFPKANYTYDKKTLFSCRRKGQALSEQNAAYFVRFLRYRFPMHPDILTALQAQRRVPNEFDFYRFNFATQSFHFTLLKTSEAERIPTVENAIAGLHREIDGADRLCETAALLNQKDFQASCAKTLQIALKAAKEKRFLDAALHFSEYTLSTGQPSLPESAPYKGDFQSDPDVRMLFAALAPKMRDETQQAVDALHGLEAKTSDAVHVLKFHEATNLKTLGETAKAQRLLREALAVNPCMVGVWKELGDNFYNNREAARAWNCWNAGRHLLATHPIFQSVFELEQKLRVDHPEFF